MIALTTERLVCTQLVDRDWPFFLALQQHPQVMRFVADKRSESEIRAAFDSRCLTGRPVIPTGSVCWFATGRMRRLVSPAIFIATMTVRKWDFYSPLSRRAEATALNHCVRCATMPLAPAVFVGSPRRSRRAIWPRAAPWKNSDSVLKASCARAISSPGSGTTTGCLAYSTTNMIIHRHPANRRVSPALLHFSHYREREHHEHRHHHAEPTGFGIY